MDFHEAFSKSFSMGDDTGRWLTSETFFFEKKTSFFIINKLNVQEIYTMRTIGKPRKAGEKGSVGAPEHLN